MTVQIIIPPKIKIFNHLMQNKIVGGVRVQILKFNLTELIKTKTMLKYPTHNLSLKTEKKFLKMTKNGMFKLKNME